MKVFVLLLCAVARAAASNAVAWPGAIPLAATQFKTIIPPQIKGFGYSSSEYINAIPSGYQPQFSYQISLPGYQTYQPVVGASYFPSNGILYPSLAPAAPIAPVSPVSPIGSFNPFAPISPIQPPQQQPVQNIPNQPTQQPAGDEDTTVIESADSLRNQQQPSQPQLPPNFSQPSLDSKNMPEFPQIPQGPQIPQAPQRPQVPQFPPAPQQFPFFPQFIQPGLNFPLQQANLQTNPTSPQGPSPSPSFPSAENTDKGLNDEDTISVDSA